MNIHQCFLLINFVFCAWFVYYKTGTDPLLKTDKCAPELQLAIKKHKFVVKYLILFWAVVELVGYLLYAKFKGMGYVIAIFGLYILNYGLLYAVRKIFKKLPKNQ